MRAKRTKAVFCDGQFLIHLCDSPKCGDFLLTVSHKCDPRICGKSDIGDGYGGTRVLRYGIGLHTQFVERKSQHVLDQRIINKLL